jgi:hypothetical protein
MKTDWAYSELFTVGGNDVTSVVTTSDSTALIYIVLVFIT